MQVYKACFKVIRRNLPSMLIYVVIFLLFVLMLTGFMQSPAQDMEFQPTKVRTAVVAEDASAPLTAGLIEFLDERTQLVELPDDRQRLQDALFHQEVSYILYVPAEFENAFEADEPGAILERSQRPDSYSAVQIDLLVDRYLNLLQLHMQQGSNLSLNEMQLAVREALQESSQVQQLSLTAAPGSRIAIRYFQYLAYSLMAVTILCICSIMLVFSRKDIRQRNHCSPLPLIRFNSQLALANLSFGVLLWLVLIAFSWTMGGASLDLSEWLLLSLNALVFTLSCLSLSFLISQFVRSRTAMQTVANILALGTSFISGVFVPLDFLGESIHSVASFTPTYWYIRAVNDIDRLSDFSRQSLQPIGEYMLIQLGFMLALLVVAMAITKQKRQSSR